MSVAFVTPPPPTATLFPYTTLFRSPLGRTAEHQPHLDRVRIGIGQHRAHRPPFGRGHLRGSLAAGEDLAARAHCELDVLPFRSEEHRLNSSHLVISYAVFCLKKKKI